MLRQKTFSCNLPRNVALQVEIVCSTYYHFLAQQIFMHVSEVEVAFFPLLVEHGGGTVSITNNRNLQSSIVARRVAQKLLPVFKCSAFKAQ